MVKFCNLPVEVAAEVMARLPTRSIKMCPRVCTTMKQIAASADFPALQAGCAKVSAVLVWDDLWGTHYSRLEILVLDGDHHDIQPGFVEFLQPDTAHIIGAASGLVFYRLPEADDKLFVCNPCRGTRCSLPPAPPACRPDDPKPIVQSAAVRFGGRFSPEYKSIVYISPGPNWGETQYSVYDAGADKWIINRVITDVHRHLQLASPVVCGVTAIWASESEECMTTPLFLLAVDMNHGGYQLIDVPWSRRYKVVKMCIGKGSGGDNSLCLVQYYRRAGGGIFAFFTTDGIIVGGKKPKWKSSERWLHLEPLGILGDGDVVGRFALLNGEKLLFAVGNVGSARWRVYSYDLVKQRLEPSAVGTIMRSSKVLVPHASTLRPCGPMEEAVNFLAFRRRRRRGFI